MKINRLRLMGFKSFVEPTELVIERGLTGVVGPNGCGKSNLLEALRWVMGESSYKSMRASTMEDVIFSGTSSRPSRNAAEVTIFLDNSERTAPAEFNDSELLEITRRIERESGSAYRINGRDVRARDVKLLFEDAATGARSPALVRQGQIGEIVNAKPEARRRILEDAAGIAGLHSRRHEAELRLRAAEGNLERLADIAGQINAQISNLRRQARQTKRYNEITEEIMRLEAAQAYLAWWQAGQLVGEAETALREALAGVGLATQAEAEVVRRIAEVGAGLAGLRDEETKCAVVLQRLKIEQDALDREITQTQARQRELEGGLVQVRADVAREAELAEEAGETITRLAEEKERIGVARAEIEGRSAELKARTEAARDELHSVEKEFSEVSTALAELSAEHRRLAAAQAQFRNRRSQIERLLEQFERDAARLAQSDPSRDVDALSSELTQLQGRVDDAERAAEAAADTKEIAHREESAARSAADDARNRLTAIQSSIATLRSVLIDGTDAETTPILDELTVEGGYEMALGAALGEDLSASRDATAAVRWQGACSGDDPVLPAGVRALADFVTAPPELARRLAQIGIIDASDGPRLSARLATGQRLVTREGALWRWDGFYVAADAPSAAARRLAEKNRLADLEREALPLEDDAAMRQAALIEACETRSLADEDEMIARRTWRELLREHEAVRARHAHAERRLHELSEKRGRLEGAQAAASEEHEGVLRDLTRVEDEIAGLADPGTLQAIVAAKNESRTAKRDQLTQAQAELHRHEHELRMRQERIAALEADVVRAQTQRERAERQTGDLEKRIVVLRQQLADIEQRPAALESRKQEILNGSERAERERKAAADDLAVAENAIRTEEERLREVQGELALAREERARVETRLDAARSLRSQTAREIREAFDCSPQDCLLRAMGTLRVSSEGGALPNASDGGVPRTLDGDPSAAGLSEMGDIQRQLTKLRSDRERLGGVNLMAADELEKLETQHAEMERERTDMEEAIARLRQGISKLNREGRRRLLEAFDEVNGHFAHLFSTLFSGGEARLELIESDDPLQSGLEIIARPPGKKPNVLSLLSGGEQTLTALSLIFAVFLTNPSPICVLDEVDAPLDDANVDRFCKMMEEMAKSTDTRFLVITHHPMTMARVDRLFGVTMAERGVSQLVSVDLATAERYRDAS